MLDQTLVLYATGSPLIVEYEEVCQRNGVKIAGVINNLPGGSNHSNLNAPQFSLDDIEKLISKRFVCPLFTPFNRYRAVTEALSLGLRSFEILTADENLLPLELVYGEGCFFNRGVICGASSSFGNHVVVNRGANLGHHFTAQDFVSVGPGVVTGGNVTLQRGALVGTGAVILPTITIGRHAVVGAGSVVTKNVDDYEVVVGNPAKKIKENRVDF